VSPAQAAELFGLHGPNLLVRHRRSGVRYTIELEVFEQCHREPDGDRYLYGWHSDRNLRRRGADYKWFFLSNLEPVDEIQS
jgi:hypothetical protein